MADEKEIHIREDLGDVLRQRAREFTAYDWMCLEKAELRATMPQKLVDMHLVESSTGVVEREGEVGLNWSVTEAGYRLLLKRRRGEF